jgi:hypothetical protein
MTNGNMQKEFSAWFSQFKNQTVTQRVVAWQAWQAAHKSAVPDGYCVVPFEPTEDMIRAAAVEVHCATYWQPAYKAMISAAPKP